MMQRRRLPWFLLVGVLVVLLAGPAACTPSEAVGEEDIPPTPTPLPPAPALERPTYEVERGAIERTIEPNGRVTPVDLVQLSFRRSGRVELVNVQRDDPVQTGDVLAQLFQDDELEELADAEDMLIQARRDLETARADKEKEIQRAIKSLSQAQRKLREAQEDKTEAVQQAEQDVQDAQEDLTRLLPGGADAILDEKQEALEEAQREAKTTQDDYSLKKTQAEHALIEATEALVERQEEYSDAYWDKAWVEEHGTHPEETEQVDPETGETRRVHAKLTDEEKEEYRRTFREAEEALAEAERQIELRERDIELAREEEVYQNQQAEEKVEEAQRELEEVQAGDSQEIIDQRRVVEEEQEALEEAHDRTFLDEQVAIEDAELEVQEARDQTFNTELKAVEKAERDLEKARREVENGQIIAPQDGQVMVIDIREGDQVEEFDPVIEIADPSHLEVSAELSGEQMRQLAEGQPAEISLLSRPDVLMPAVIRRLPAPYGSGGSGVVQEEDRRTLFEIQDTKGQELQAGAVAKIRIVLERKEEVLLLPPDAIRSFEGRTFVIVREGDRERRVTVKTGIETPDVVEIIEGVEAGDVVVGQ
jgi:multidrug efflux pump subunit AcrA (membrane-fusion protein)